MVTNDNEAQHGDATHVVMFSGGIGSWATARRVRREIGPRAELICLFADTKMEDEDLYRFLYEGVRNVAGRLVEVAEGRTPWEVFFDVRFLGNHRIDPCSRILKRQLLRKWLEDNCDPETTTVYLGIDWTEDHRFLRAKRYWEPWKVEAPLCHPPLVMKPQLLDALRADGIKPPRLYELGHPHNNCGGFCIKAGQAHFKLLLDTMPERYAYHEQKEQEIREYLDADVAILTDRSDGKAGAERRPLTMKEFRERIEAGRLDQCDLFEWGGCACFTPDEYTDEEMLETARLTAKLSKT
jgi:hypothetical protein